MRAEHWKIWDPKSSNKLKNVPCPNTWKYLEQGFSLCAYTRDALKYKEKKPWSASISTQGLRSISWALYICKFEGPNRSKSQSKLFFYILVEFSVITCRQENDQIRSYITQQILLIEIFYTLTEFPWSQTTMSLQIHERWTRLPFDLAFNVEKFTN